MTEFPPPPAVPPEGAIPFPFSVSATKQVYFSQGNLQWSATDGGVTPTTHVTADGVGEGTWRFAEEQYHFVGNTYYGNVYGVGGNSGTKCDNSLISASYQGWIDLFGWGTSGYDNTANDQYAINYQPYSNSTTSLYPNINRWGYGPSWTMTDRNLVGTSAYYDWGVYNAISNGGNQVGLWRTLTYEEWGYLMYSRPNASSLWVGAVVDGLPCHIVLPDDFVTPSGITVNSGCTWYTNVYSLAEWSLLEANGAVMLVSPGYRSGTSVTWNGTIQYNGGRYAETKASSNEDSNYVIVRNNSPSYWEVHTRYMGCAVRLVHDIN